MRSASRDAVAKKVLLSPDDDKSKEGKFSSLPLKSVDTGSGLERMEMIIMTLKLKRFVFLKNTSMENP